MIAAFSPNIDVANAALPTYITALLFAAGYLLRWHDIPKYWIWCVFNSQLLQQPSHVQALYPFW